MKRIFNLIFGVPYFLVTVKDKKARAQRIDKGQLEAYKSNSMFDRKIILELEIFNIVVIFEDSIKTARIKDEGENYKIEV